VARTVVFRPQAEDEVLEVRQWYEANRAGLGQEFGQELDALVERIAERPLAFPRVHHETRRAVLSENFIEPLEYSSEFLLSGVSNPPADAVHRERSNLADLHP